MTRAQINDAAWDACVAASVQRIVYGYAWYLDAVLPGPAWTWVAWVLPGAGGTYRAVLPVPLRRRYFAGVSYDWVVCQPLFCQLLGLFSRHATAVDVTPFLQAVQQRFRCAIAWNVRQVPADVPGLMLRQPATHILDLSVGYDALYANYTRDRRTNLRRAQTAGWVITDSTDIEPLIGLFRENHAGGIRGGVGEWAYDIFRRLYAVLHERGLATLRYAGHDGRIEAGALFVREGNRIVYLFNAASESGRRGNARTLLLDQVIRHYAGQPAIFDFESPEKASIVQFYQSFGAREEPFGRVSWDNLNAFERMLLRVKQRFAKSAT